MNAIGSYLSGVFILEMLVYIFEVGLVMLLWIDK